MKTESESSFEEPLEFNDVRLAIMSVFSFPKLGLGRNETQELVHEALSKKEITAEDVHDKYFYYLPQSLLDDLFRFKLELRDSDFSFNEACKETGLSGCAFETFLTVYPKEDFAILLLNVQISKCDADDLIVLQQSVERDKMTIFSEIDAPSLNKIIDKYITKILEALPKVHTEEVFRRYYHCIEICGFANSKIADPNLILEEFPKQIYGLLAQDEGWRFVPRETAKERLQNKWQTRDFVDAVAFDKSVVFFNLHYQRYKEYQKSQDQVREKYGIQKEPDSETRIAGLKDGPLLTLENAALQLFMIDQISKKFGIERKKIREIDSFREELSDAVTNLSLVNFVIPEIAFLQKAILKATGVPKAKKGLKNKLGEVENSLLLRYNQSFNTLIGYLTGVGVAVAVLTIAIQLHWL